MNVMTSIWQLRLEKLVRIARVPVCLAVSLVVIVLCTVVAFNQVTTSSLLREERVSLSRYLDGSADRPFIFRVLTPRLIAAIHATGATRLIDANAPAAVKAKLKDLCAPAQGRYIEASCDNVIEYFCLAVTALTSFSFFMYSVSYKLFRNRLTAGFTMFLSVFSVNAIIRVGISHLYDLTLLASISILLYTMLKQRHWWFTILMLLACLNKETAIFYAVPYAVYDSGPTGTRRKWAAMAAMMIGFAIIVIVTRLGYRTNPGVPIEFWLRSQVQYYVLNLTLQNLLLLLAAILMIFKGFPDKPVFLKVNLLVAVPLLPLLLLSAFPGELRNLFEILPVLVLMATHTVITVIGSYRPSRPMDADQHA